ncbi:hypothetical protein SEA_AMORE2_82 [Gordonia phage Amore2]|nr:hypothetical protein SEA_AUSTIN_81 [Gordonia phage Austin]USH44897.1 hypothetical protein SEA_AMORE2_82 [Gordonia phage Amore2]
MTKFLERILRVKSGDVARASFPYALKLRGRHRPPCACKNLKGQACGNTARFLYLPKDGGHGGSGAFAVCNIHLQENIDEDTGWAASFIRPDKLAKEWLDGWAYNKEEDKE